MTRSITRHLHSDAVASKPQRPLTLHVPLLLAIFGILLQLTSPIADIWHVQSEYADRFANRSVSWQATGYQVDTRASLSVPAQPPKTQHDPVTCRVCQLLSHIQHALHAQSLVLTAMAILFGFIFCTTSTPYFLPHACPDSRAPPPLVS